MRTILALVAACLLIGCGKSEPKKAPLTELEASENSYQEWAARQPRPTPKMVDHIERLLVQESCIGDLTRWSRFYAYDMLPQKTVDMDIVDFHLEEAGGGNVKAGRQIRAPIPG